MAFESESDTDHPASTHRPTATASKTKSKTDQPTAESVFAETTSIEVRSPTRKRFTAESDHDDRRRQRKEGIHYSSEETPTTAETGASASKIALPRLKTVPRKLKKLQLPSHPVPIRPAPSRQRTLLLNADIANPDSSTPATYSVRTPTIPTVPLPAPTYHTIASPTYTGQPVTIIPGLSTALAAIQHNVYERRPIRDEFVSSRVVTDPSSPKNDEDQATEPRSNFYTLFQDQPGNLLVRSNFHSEPKITRIILRPYTQAVTSFSPVDAFVSDGISRLTERLKSRLPELGTIMFNGIIPILTEHLAELLVEAYQNQTTNSSTLHPGYSVRISELQNHIAEIELENKNLGELNKRIPILEKDHAGLKEKVTKLEKDNALLKGMVDVKVPQMEEQIRVLKALKEAEVGHSSSTL